MEDCIANCAVVAPSGFSPNGDGANDRFKIINTCDEGFSYFDLKMYDRWGTLIFQTLEPIAFWDGTFLGRNSEVGTYIYFLEYTKEFSNEKEVLKGNVTLIR